MKICNAILRTLPVIVVLLACLCLFVGCSSDIKPQKNVVTVTLLNGEHYTVIGENKKTVADDRSVSFDVTLDAGYKITGAEGDDLSFTQDLSFKQTVTFTDVRYKTVARLETAALAEYGFAVFTKQQDCGNIQIDTTLGEAKEDVYYEGDIINLFVTPNGGYNFLGWSTEGYLADGGSFFSSEKNLVDFDYMTYSALYANFKEIGNTENTVYYRFENGLEINQDCTALLAHHVRANTLTASDVQSYGVDSRDRMLVGWQTADGEYVGLGSRITVSKASDNILVPIWKEYTDSDLFSFTADGEITAFHDESNSDEVVVPRKIGQTTITAINANAFENCTASAYYLPDTITTIEDNAFLNCVNLVDFYMSDNIVSINDSAFTGCVNFKSLHLNAALKPRYMSYNSVKSEVYDRLIVDADNGQQKLVMLGGSSVRYGYSEKVINELFDNSPVTKPNVYNLGLSIDTVIYPQFEMARATLRRNDIFLHAPEVSRRAWVGRFSPSAITGADGIAVNYRIFEVTECNWSLLSYLTVNKYNNLFEQLCSFNKTRMTLKEKNYTDYFRYAADNAYGVRENTEYVLKEQGVDKSFDNDGNINFDKDLDRSIEVTCGDMYAYLNGIGAKLYVSFAPISRHNLLNTYKTEDELKAAADIFTDYIKTRLNGVDCTILLSQYDTIYDGKHFSNSDYHLGDPFRDEHTANVISALIVELQKESEAVV